MGKAIGFLGQSVAAVVTFVTVCAGLTAFVIAWKAGILPVLGEAFLFVIKGLFVTLPVAVIKFFTALIGAF